MRKIYHTILKRFFRSCLVRERSAKKFTQAKMSEILIMDNRSYVDLEHGKSCCSAITLALFLVYICDDIALFIQELRNAFEEESNWAA